MWITDGGATYIAGQNYSLTCRTLGTGSRVTTYQWRKNGLILHGETKEMLSFSPLRLSDGGWYTCVITAGGVFNSSEENIAVMSKVE